MAPVLQEKCVKASEAFFVNDGDLDSTREIKLTVKFPTNVHEDRTNDISMYFKRFATVLLAAHPSISTLNWEHPSQNPVTKAVDISPNEASIKQYFIGVVIQANRQKIKGFVKIQSTTPFSAIKRNDRLWSWLTKNKVFVRTTQLAQSRHVNIGWCLYSHAEYSNQELARADLQRRMGRECADFELVPHTSSHITSDGTKITTKSLKVRADHDSRQEIFRGLLECMKLGTDNPKLTDMSNTGEWKLIPFAQNTISRDQMTDLIQKQNRYLHDVRAISFINLGSLEGSFYQETAREGGNGKRKEITQTGDDSSPIVNKKSTGEDDNFQSTTGDECNTGIDAEMTDTAMEDKIETPNTNEALGNEATGDDDVNNNFYQGVISVNTTGEVNSPPIASPETLLEMLTISAGDGSSLFTSWEPGRLGQFYFMTTSALEDRAADWLDTTMNTLLNIYGLKKCARVFGSNLDEMPREETKVRPDSFILDYISTLKIDKNLNRERGGKKGLLRIIDQQKREH